ncbi:MAG: hypothetical protein RR585_08870 [Coprobacillus sp.]
MKKLALLIMLVLTGCTPVNQSANIKEDNFIKNNSKEIVGNINVELLKSDKDVLYFTDIKENRIEKQNGVYVEVNAKQQIYKYENEKATAIIESSFSEGNIYEFYINGDKVIYADFNGQTSESTIMIYDQESMKKKSIVTIKQFLPSIYVYESKVYYVEYKDEAEVIEYNLETETKKTIYKQKNQHINITGFENNVCWYADNTYFVYDNNTVKQVTPKYVNNSTPILFDGSIYCIEKNKDGNLLIMSYDLSHDSYKEYNFKMIENFCVSKDYIIVTYGSTVSFYNKNTSEMVKTYELNEIKHISVNEEKCLMAMVDNKYMFFDMAEIK